MPDTFAITILFIALTTIVAAFVRRRSRDKCVKDFESNTVTLEEISGKVTSGALRLENTGLELIYPKYLELQDDEKISTYILYKYEFPNIQALIRFHDDLSDEKKKLRDKELRRTYHPNFFRRTRRKIVNLFKTVRDSIMEVTNMMMSHAKKTSTVLTSQDKYVNQIKQELVGTVGTSYEPILERHIGHKVVIEMIKGDKIKTYRGVLKEYTSEFIEIMDVQYIIKETAKPRTADLVILRKQGIVRHLGE